MNRAVAFLDLLGFKNFMSMDKEGAIRLIWNYELIIGTKLISVQKDPVSSYEKNLKVLAEARSADHFDYFLPFSDSLIIIAKNSDIEIFLKQIGSFLIEAFLLTAREYRNENQPTVVKMMHIIANENGQFTKQEVEEYWFPTLFRGGISFGDVESLEQCAIVSGKPSKSYGIAGSALIDAVQLETKVENPGVILHESICSKISDDNFKNKYILVENGLCQLLWPALHYIEGNSPETELLKFNDLFTPVVFLWKTYSHLRCAELYFNLLRLIVKSTSRFFKDLLSEEQIKFTIQGIINRLGIAYKSAELFQ